MPPNKGPRKRPASALGTEAAAADAEAVATAAAPRAGGLPTLLAPLRAGLAATAGYATRREVLQKVAGALMNHWDLLVAGRRHRILELEAYVHGPAHADPYTHRDEGQEHCAAWYFHRKGGNYKGGSFKGLDLACGGGRGSGVCAGLLLRSVAEDATGELAEGPCLVVDRILRLSGRPSVAALTGGRPAEELSAASFQDLRLAPAAAPRGAAVWAAPRVGLVLRAEGAGATHSEGSPADFCTRAYRFSTQPERLGKWRSGFAAVAHLDQDPARRPETLRLPPRKLEEYLAAVEAGRAHSDPASFVNRPLRTQPELCELVGACTSSVGRGDAAAA